MSAPRRFDHDEARRFYATGDWSYAALGRHYGVTDHAIRAAVNPDVRRMKNENSRAYVTMICEDCGGQCIHNYWAKTVRNDRIVCRACAFQRLREESLLARMNAAGDLLCRSCGKYKPMTDFVAKANGSPRPWCRECSTAARQAHRVANLEASRAYDREYRRRRRAARERAA